MADLPVLLDATGKPLPKGRRNRTTAEEYLLRAGVEYRADGSMVVPPEVLQRLRSDRMRGMSRTSVPSTPQHMMRDGGGVGVAKGHGRFRTMSIEALRGVRERSAMLQVIHAARGYQMRRMAQRFTGRKGDVGWRICHRDHQEPNAEQPDGFQKFIDEFERMWMKPHPVYCKNPMELLGPLSEDFMTINRPTVEVLPSAFDNNKIAGWRPVDGGLIWPTLHYLEYWQRTTPDWHGPFDPDELSTSERLELASDMLGADMVGAEYCLVREGVMEAVYPRDRLIVAPLVTRTDVNYAGYQPSHVENAMELVLSHMNAFDYNGSYFTRGMMAEFILGISGDVDDESLDSFMDMFREATSGVRRAWQPPVMPLPLDGTIQKIDLRQSNRDMMMELWMSVLSSMCAAIYRIDMSAINMKPWDGGGGGSLSEPSREKEITLAKEEGLQGDLTHLNQSIFNELAQRCHPDLMVVWEYGDTDIEKEARTNKVRAEVDTTRNELRLESGRKPMGFWVKPEEYDDLSDEQKLKFDANLWNMPADPSFMSTASMQAEQAAQPDEQGEDTDGFGGGADEPDGFGGEQQYPFGKQDPDQPAEASEEDPAQPGDDEQQQTAMRKAREGRINRPRKVTVYVEEYDHE